MAMCYANSHISVFEKLLVDVPEREIPIVLLASIIFENCGLAKIKEYLPAAIKSSNAFWVPIPNQYILRDRAWLFPVIRACDPDRRTFTDADYSSRIIEDMGDCLGVDIKNKEKEVIVDIKHSLVTLAYIISHPDMVGMSQRELDSVMTHALTEEIFDLLKTQKTDTIAPTVGTLGNDDLSKGLTALVFMIALFVSSCLVIGRYLLY